MISDDHVTMIHWLVKRKPETGDQHLKHNCNKFSVGFYEVITSPFLWMFLVIDNPIKLVRLFIVY